jgi:hypothetical protein
MSTAVIVYQIKYILTVAKHTVLKLTQQISVVMYICLSHILSFMSQDNTSK